MQFASGSLQQQKVTPSIWLIKLQYIVFALWTHIQDRKAELGLAQSDQRPLLK